MFLSEEICLDCPYCHAELHRPLAWFRQPWFTCPTCGGGLVCGQFEGAVLAIEEAFDARIAEEIEPPRAGCGCGGCRSC